jgi:hypothetical protein
MVDRLVDYYSSLPPLSREQVGAVRESTSRIKKGFMENLRSLRCRIRSMSDPSLASLNHFSYGKVPKDLALGQETFSRENKYKRELFVLLFRL